MFPQCFSVLSHGKQNIFSASRQKHILLWQNWETSEKHVSAANASGDTFPRFARASFINSLKQETFLSQLRKLLESNLHLRKFTPLKNYREICIVVPIVSALSLSPQTGTNSVSFSNFFRHQSFRRFQFARRVK